MKGKTLMKIGIGWVSALLVGVAVLSIATRVFANQFLGLGIVLPFRPDTLLGRVGIAGFLFVGYLILLGWIPFLLIGILRVWRQRKREIGIEGRYGWQSNARSVGRVVTALKE